MLIVVDDRCMYVDRMPVWIVESKVVLMYICMTCCGESIGSNSMTRSRRRSFIKYELNPSINITSCSIHHYPPPGSD